MQLIIDEKSGIPIYDQIYQAIRQQILDGRMPEGEMLPSIRNLAKDLKISVITTKRAYEELEKEGCIYPVPGKGFYVAPLDVALVRRAHTAEIETHLKEIRKLAAPLGITKEEVAGMLEAVFAAGGKETI